MKINIKTQVGLIYGFITLLFIVTRFILFQGFNGTDDLHYAMLASKLLQGRYNPFETHDIFSGRVVLILIQTLIYKIGGISVITTSVGTVVAVIITCWLVVYKILTQKSPTSTLLTCCLFYFNPVLTESTTGILPDPYVMLSGTLVFLLVKPRDRQSVYMNHEILNNILAGSIIALTLLVKETVLVFLPFAVTIQIIPHVKKGILNGSILMLSFLSVIIFFGLCYHYLAGDAFVKLTQIENSAYPNPCNFDNLPLKNFFVRMTYGVYIEFIVNGFYPVLFGCIVMIARLLTLKKISLGKDLSTIYFPLLLFISLYFPFSLKAYQPLCANCRHFLFLMPFAVPFVVDFFFGERGKQINILTKVLFLLSGMLCILNSENKWQWMIYGLIFICFSLSSTQNSFFSKRLSTFLSIILFISIFESKFFNKTHWFQDMKGLSDQLSSKYYYFPDHDNMMHWKVIHKFNDTSIHYITLEKEPFPIFKLYDQFPDQKIFNPGWLIVNKRYTVIQQKTINRIDSLQRRDSLQQIFVGDVKAIYVQNKKQLLDYETIIKNEYGL